jgi:hypothetical protein
MSYPPPPPPDPSGGYGYGGYAAPRTNQKAIWSLVTGILGLVCCAPAGIVALVLGNSAKKEIAASGGAETGGGMAQAGVVLGIIAIVLFVIGILGFLTGMVTFPTTSSP